MINWGILGLGRMGTAFANAIDETTNSKLIRDFFLIYLQIILIVTLNQIF